MATPTLANTIADDLARKCGEDVAALMHRAFKLCDSQGACVMAAVTGASMAMAQVTGVLLAGQNEPVDAAALDAIWKDLIRPLALTAIGDRGPFVAMLAEVAAKPARIAEAAR